MTEPAGWRNGLEPKIADEAEHVIRAFGDAPEELRRRVTVVPDGAGGINHMHAEGEILVREEHLPRVLEILGQPSREDLERDEPGRHVRRVIAGHVLLALRDPHSTVAEALDLVDGALGRGIATPNHVVTVAPGRPGVCPATEPEGVYYDAEPFPSVCHDNGGTGVLVYLADTGLLRDAATHPWLAGVRVIDPEQDCDPRTPLQGDPPEIPPYTGHGTFVAGVLRCLAPAADVIVENAFSVAGSALEADLVPRLEAALGLGVDIFHLSIACVTRNDLPLIALGEWLRRLGESKGAVCLAAAGNSAIRRPVWPAAFPGVVAVGALGGDWRGRASFSNFGPWVDVYAPGRDIVNAYATGEYTCHVRPYVDDKRTFYGMAKWSGTSFSTPIVTGLIAARMSATGENARQATAALLAQAQSQAIPGVGPVLLPPR
jgi:subtilisin family serine protease